MLNVTFSVTGERLSALAKHGSRARVRPRPAYPAKRGEAMQTRLVKVAWICAAVSFAAACTPSILVQGIIDIDTLYKSYGPSPAIPFAPDKLYFTITEEGVGLTRGNIDNSNLDGTKLQSVYGGTQFPDGIALDFIWRNMYWTDRFENTIRTATLAGQNPSVLIPNLKAPSGIAVDAFDSLILWVERGTGQADGTLSAADFHDGSNATQLLSGLALPGGVALDLVNRAATHGPSQTQQTFQVYFTEETPKTIKRGDVTVTRDAKTYALVSITIGNVQVVVTDNSGSPVSVALDLVNKQMYWSNRNNIMRSNLDGSQTTSIVQSFFLYQIALDLTAKKIYFTSKSGDQDISHVSGTIGRCDLDGKNCSAPNGIIPVQTHILAVALGVASRI